MKLVYCKNTLCRLVQYKDDKNMKKNYKFERTDNLTSPEKKETKQTAYFYTDWDLRDHVTQSSNNKWTATEYTARE